MFKNSLLISLIFFVASTEFVTCFIPAHRNKLSAVGAAVYSRRIFNGATLTVSAKSNKGFGEREEPKQPNKKVANTATTVSPEAQSVTAVATTSSSEQQLVQKQEVPKLNAGQVALEKLRRENAEKKDAELRKVREMLAADEQARVTPTAIPEPVAMRMGQRMLPFVGLPLFLGMGTFVSFWYMATYRDLEFQPALVATSTIILLFIGLLGITYSVMSASWDPDREGSFFGFDEFQKNLQNIQQGFDRSKENTILREKVARLDSDEIQTALTELEQRDKKKQQEVTKQSLQSKLENELE